MGSCLQLISSTTATPKCTLRSVLFSFVHITVWTYFDLDILAWLLSVLAVIPNATLFSRGALEVLRVSAEII